jgi:hypothetical protein
MQLDVFTVPPEPQRRIRRRRMPATSAAARVTVTPAIPQQLAKILEEVKAAGLVGRTRKEIAQRTGIEIQSVTWRVDELLRSGEVFERMHTVGDKRAFQRRQGSKILIAAIAAATDHPESPTR